MLSFWLKKIQKITIKSNESFSFQIQQDTSPLAIYCGYVLFLQALNYQSSNEILYSQYLDVAIAAFGSFHALNFKAIDLIAQQSLELSALLENETSDSEIDSTVLALPLSEFLLHHRDILIHGKTPGCLLLANICIFLSNFHQGYNSLLSQKFLEDSWQYLHMAYLLENYSAVEINNAYLGKGIAASNHLKIATIFDLKKVVMQEADENLSLGHFQRIESSAEELVKQFFPQLDCDTEALVASDLEDNEEYDLPSNRSLSRLSQSGSLPSPVSLSHGCNTFFQGVKTETKIEISNKIVSFL